MKFTYILLCIIVFELALLFVQHFQPENLTIIYSVVNSLIGYIISNYILKKPENQEKIKKLSEKKNQKTDLDID